MATYALIHGGGDSAFYWHLLEPELRARGHEVVAMDLPCEDDSAGFAEYADAVVGERDDLARPLGCRGVVAKDELVEIDRQVLIGDACLASTR